MKEEEGGGGKDAVRRGLKRGFMCVWVGVMRV